MRYHTGVPIGRGGMSEVLEAWDPERRRRVALKLLSHDDPELAERMLEEARAQALVEHPNVCRVYEVGRLDGRPYIAMQRVEGVTLDRAAPDMTLEQKVRLMRTVAEAVHAAHRVGLIHRDLKPGNILVEETAGGYKPYVADFGIARRQEVQGLTLTGQLVGTPGYMSPEQARGETKRLDRRSDVFQLGVVLYELLVGERPFSGHSRIETLIQILEKDPPPLRRKAPHLPADLETVTTRCLEKEPSRRYPSARALAEDLGRFLEGEPILARPVGPVRRLARRARRHPVFSTFAVTAPAALLVLTGLWLSARWTAAERARLAGRLGQQVERLDSVLRFAHLAPLHDVRPTRDRLRRRLRQMTEEIRQLPRPLAAVGHAAVGRGHLALGDLATAKRHLETAWAAGERGPEVARALGRILSDLYRERLERAAGVRDPELRRAAREEAERRYRDPALRYLEAARRASSRDPGPAPELLEARVAWIEQRWTEARRAARSARTASPWLYEAAVLEGDVARSQALELRSAGATETMEESFERARGAYRRAMEIGRSDPVPAERLCALQARRMEVAYFDLGAPVEPLLEQVERSCGRALRADPDRATPHVVLASAGNLMSRALASRGEDPRPALERSLTAAGRALELCTRKLPTRCLPSTRAVAHRRRGDAFSYRAEWERQHGLDPRSSLAAAIEQLERAVLLAPRDPGAFNSLGLAHWERIELARLRGEDPSTAFAVAAGAFRRAGELLPGYTHAHSNLGAILRLQAEQVLERGGDPEPFFEEAVTSFRRALEANPSNSHALNNLGSVSLERGHFRLEHGRDPRAVLEQALDLYRRATERKSDWAFPHFNRGLAHRALALDALHRGKDPRPHLERAAAAFEAGHALRDDLALTHVELARVHLLAARWALEVSVPAAPALTRADRELEQALGLDPGSAEALQSRGEAELLRGELDSAHRTLLRALERREGDADTLHLLAEVWLHRAERRREKGDRLFEEAISEGLIRAAEALAGHPRKATTWGLRGRLELLSAQVADQASAHATAHTAVQTSAATRRAAVPSVRPLARQAAASLSQAIEINPALERRLGPELEKARALAASGPG